MEARKKLFSWQSVFGIAILTAIAFVIAGCASQSMTNPPRAATEQLLLSTSADRALAAADLNVFIGRKVFLDTTYFDSYDSAYAIGEIRDALSRAGALLVPDSKSADIILEARSGALSVDSDTSLLGIPTLVIPIPFVGPLQIPELAFYKTEPQNSYAKIALLAYANQSRKHVYSSGPLLGRSYNKYHEILFASWITTDIPEKQKTKKKMENDQTWFPQYDLRNMPPVSTNAAASPAAPAATNAPATTVSTNIAAFNS
jgi:hypothetical protein